MPGKPSSLGIYYLLDYSPEGIGHGLIRASGGFQAMIDACGEGGGGLCAVPAGLYFMDATPTWRGWTNVTIWVHSGAVFTGPGALPANAGSNVVRTEPSAVTIGGTPVTQAFGDAAAQGNTGVASDAGHRHGMPGNGSVGTAQLAANAVTQVQETGAITAAPTTTSGTFVDLPDMQSTLVTTGGGLLAVLQVIVTNSLAGAIAEAALSLDGAGEVAALAMWTAAAGYGGSVTCVYFWPAVAAGTHTIKGRWFTTGGTATALNLYRQLTVMEIRR